MTKKEIIAAIRVLLSFRAVTLKDIEKTLGMPKNCLSGMLSGSRALPERWEQPLIAFIRAKNNGAKEIVIPIQTAPPKKKKAKQNTALPETPVLPAPNPEKYAPPRPIEIKDELPAAKTLISNRIPPPGLSKSEQIRWHREHNQTLQ